MGRDGGRKEAIRRIGWKSDRRKRGRGARARALAHVYYRNEKNGEKRNGEKEIPRVTESVSPRTRTRVSALACNILARFLA